MKTILFSAAIALALSAGTASAVDPIPGSITYGGQPRTKLLKSPIGSTFTHELTDEYGDPATETYRIEPDRSLKLIRRESKPDIFNRNR